MSFKTPADKELKMIKLKGKDYLPVQERLIWFREVNPTWTIRTLIIQSDENYCLSKAEIVDDTGRLRASAHKSETLKGFADYIEKSETGAIGRALAFCGFGTQFVADEFDEKDRLADAPRNISAAVESYYDLSSPPAIESFADFQQLTPNLTPNKEHPKCEYCGKKMLKSKFDTGKPFYCPDYKNHMNMPK